MSNPWNCSYCCGCGYFALTLHWSCLALASWPCFDLSLTLFLPCLATTCLQQQQMINPCKFFGFSSVISTTDQRLIYCKMYCSTIHWRLIYCMMYYSTSQRRSIYCTIYLSTSLQRSIYCRMYCSVGHQQTFYDVIYI